MADYNNNNQYGRKPRHSPGIPAGRLQPQELEVEQLVLGSLMLEEDAYSQVADLLVPESFYDIKHQKVYNAIQTLAFEQKPVDLATVTDMLKKQGEFEEIGGYPFIAELFANVTSAAHVEYHAHIIAQKYLARRLISFSSEIQTAAFDDTVEVEDLLQQAEGKLFEISQNQLKREVVQIDSIVEQAKAQIQAAFNNKSGLSGLASGFHSLDAITSGWQPDDLIIIAARPAMGKTAFVLSMAKNIAVDFNVPTAVFSLEMSNVQLINRIIANVCEIPGNTIRSGKLSDDEWDRLESRSNMLYGAPLYIDETPGLSITELRTKARRLVREHQVKIIIIDYLQLMNASGMKFGSREQEVSTISRNLKALAKELHIPIIALSQLNRSTETREDKRPVLSDLRESGAIEQDADFVAFIHRPEYYTRSSEDAEGKDIRGLAEFIIAKHRSGQVDTVKMRFTDKYVRFENWGEQGQRLIKKTVRPNRDSGADPLAGTNLAHDPFANGADADPFGMPPGTSPFDALDPFAGPGPDLGSDPTPF